MWREVFEVILPIYFLQLTVDALPVGVFAEEVKCVETTQGRGAYICKFVVGFVGFVG